MVFVIVGVAFLTLLESKVLGYIHIRKGPNRFGFVGIFQPFSKATKLFCWRKSISERFWFTWPRKKESQGTNAD